MGARMSESKRANSLYHILNLDLLAYVRLRSLHVGCMVYISFSMFYLKCIMNKWMIVVNHTGTASLWKYCGFSARTSLIGEATDNSFNNKSSLAGTTWLNDTAELLLVSTMNTTDTDGDREGNWIGNGMSDICRGYGIVGVDGYLHSVRFCTCCAIVCIGYGFLRNACEWRRNWCGMHANYSTQSCLLIRNIAEEISLLGAVFNLTAVEVYQNYFKTDSIILAHIKEVRGPNGEHDGDLIAMDIYPKFLRGSSCFIMAVAVLLMVANSLPELVLFVEKDVAPKCCSRRIVHLGDASRGSHTGEADVEIAEVDMGTQTACSRISLESHESFITCRDSSSYSDIF